MDNGWDVHARLLLICDLGYPHCHDGSLTQYVWKKNQGQRGGWKGLVEKGKEDERRGEVGRGEGGLTSY
jgi:hypothetical protein